MIKKILFILCLYFPFCLVSCSVNNNEKIQVTEIIDGDTFKSEEKSLRLFGVDTPETKENICGIWVPTKGLKKYWADKAYKFTKSKLEGKKINITKISIDDYGRIVSKWEYKNDFGILLVSLGLARVKYISSKAGDKFYTADHEYYEKLLLAQKFAFDNNNGFWKNSEKLSQIFS